MSNISFIQTNNDHLQIRTNIGNYFIKNKYLNKYFIGLFILIVVVLCYYYGFKGLLLIFSGIFPSIIIAYLLVKNNNNEINISNLLDFFTIGATFSVLLTIFIEGIILNIFLNQKNNCLINDKFKIIYGCTKGFIYCSLITVIKYIVSVGLVEESSKLIGLLTINTKIHNLNQYDHFFSHYINSNIEYVLSGIFCSIGFATIENIAYLVNCIDDLYSILFVSIARGLLSIPFHISASGYSCILLSKQIFKSNNLYTINNKFNSNFMTILCLIPASILHGLYDACLVILLILDKNNNNSNKSSINNFIYNHIIKYFSIGTFDDLKKNILMKNGFNNCFNNKDIDIFSSLLLLLALFSLITCIILFIYNWYNLEKQTTNRYITNNINIELVNT